MWEGSCNSSILWYCLMELFVWIDDCLSSNKTRQMRWKRRKTYIRTCAPRKCRDQTVHTLTKSLLFEDHIELTRKNRSDRVDMYAVCRIQSAKAQISLLIDTVSARRYAPQYPIPSRKHAYIILTPLNPTFIYQNWGLQGYTLFFLFLLKNIDCRYSLEPPRRGGSNEYPQSIFWAEIWKISEVLSENFLFLEVKLSIYLNKRVFVMFSCRATKALISMCFHRNNSGLPLPIYVIRIRYLRCVTWLFCGNRCWIYLKYWNTLTP